MTFLIFPGRGRQQVLLPGKQERKGEAKSSLNTFFLNMVYPAYTESVIIAITGG